ncbi:MAG: hypothetical protein JSS67_03530 [Bacteroidetes bacterium]|nr:hypothetical protein [Bacteroidota bacterium]
MSGPMSLFDPQAGQEAKGAGQALVTKNHPVDTQACLDALVEVARTHASFTADHVHEELVRRGVRRLEEPNTYGAVFSLAVTEGYITRGGRVQPSNRKAAKGRNLLVWDSMLFGRGAA